MLVAFVRVAVIIGCRLVAEQRAFQFLITFAAVGCLGQAEQGQWFFQLCAHSRDLGFVGGAGGRMLEAEQVHRRAVQLQLQGLVVQHHIQARGAVLMGGEAAMGVVMIVVVVFMGMGDGQGQQGKRQGKQQTTHGRTPQRHWIGLVML
uniref:Uncharacterized protein n=1 Tax=Pseudomonas fluorescens TaxID=294 RepID=A0A5E6X8B4_PSEFL|nr:hypothetical protein PS652_05195 [Pseudomonas fluorescens]